MYGQPVAGRFSRPCCPRCCPGQCRLASYADVSTVSAILARNCRLRATQMGGREARGTRPSMAGRPGQVLDPASAATAAAVVGIVATGPDLGSLCPATRLRRHLRRVKVSSGQEIPVPRSGLPPSAGWQRRH